MERGETVISQIRQKRGILGKEQEVEILKIILKEKWKERYRGQPHGFGARRAQGNLPVLRFRLYPYFRLVVLSSMLETTDFSNKSVFLNSERLSSFSPVPSCHLAPSQAKV